MMLMLPVRRGAAGSTVLRWKPGGGPDREPLPVSGARGLRLGCREVGNQRAALQVRLFVKHEKLLS